MPATTTRLALPYATPDDTSDVPRDIKALAEKLDQVIAIPEAGDLKFSARTAEHGNWIKADGRALTAGQFTPLRNALIADGSPFGATSGNPKLPDMTGRVPQGASGSYGHGTQGGAAQHTLSYNEMPVHSHSASTGGSATADIAGGGAGGYRVMGSSSSGGSSYGAALLALSLSTGISNAGGGLAHNNMQPYTVGQWFIYAG